MDYVGVIDDLWFAYVNRLPVFQKATLQQAEPLLRLSVAKVAARFGRSILAKWAIVIDGGIAENVSASDEQRAKATKLLEQVEDYYQESELAHFER